MRRATLMVAVAVIAAGLLLTWANAAADNSAFVDELIGQLGSADFAKRDQAAKALQARGPSVLPLLRKATKHPDAEVRRRVAELIPILEHIAAVEPKRVTLTAKKRPLSAILKEIEKQTGYKVEEDERNDQKHFAFEMKDVPFWDALERIRRAIDCDVDTGKEPGELRLTWSETGSPFTVVSDSFRLELTGIQEDRGIDFRKRGNDKELGRRSNQFRVSVSVLAEPRFTILGVGTPKVETAQDEYGKPLTVPPPPGKDELGIPEKYGRNIHTFHEEFTLKLQRCSEQTRTIKELRGTIPVQVVAVRKPITVVTEKFLGLLGTKCQIDGEPLEITRADQLKSGHYVFRMKLPPVHEELPWNNWEDRIHLEDANGNRLEVSMRNSRQEADERSVTLIFTNDPAFGSPVKVIVESWTVLRHPIPFVFKDVPLP